jgi:hypothetical protein
MMEFSSSNDKAASKGGGGLWRKMQASLFDRLSSTVGGEDNAVNDSMESLESVEQDDVPKTVPDNPPYNPPLCEWHSITLQGDSGNDGVDELVTPNVQAHLKRAGDLMIAHKTKILSNKSKECTLIAGAIVKMIERQESRGMAASISMMLMRQLNAMNSSLERREQQERRQERRQRKKRKLCKKRRAMKKAKKEARKATLANLDDHGGKARLDSSSSSGSNSDISDSDSDSSSHTSQSSNYGRGSWLLKGDLAKEDE